MSEIISQTNNEMSEGTSSDITGQLEPIIQSLEEQRDARERAEIFISEHAESLGAIMGVTGIKIEVGSGWATVLKTGTVTVDPSFFIEQGYRPDWVNYGLMHEVSAHLVGVINDPEQTRERMDFVGSDESKHLFINILEDIAGNRRIHSLLPRQRDVANELYSEKLFPEGDLTEIPRHLQLLYKLIREEMIVGSQTAVLPEVDDAISSIRDINGQDVIELSTSRIIKGTNEELSRSVQFRLWMEYIYPKFEELLELDRQDPNFKKGESGEPGDQSESSESGESGEPGDQSESSESGESGEPGESGDESESSESGEPGEEGDPSNGEKNSSNANFDEYYADYETNRHPEPIDHEELEDILEESINKQKQDQKEARENTPAKKAEKRLRDELGDRFKFRKPYRTALEGVRPQIDEMREFFSTLLDERVIQIRRLKRASSDGMILNPSALSQTIVDLKTGIKNPPEAFLDYDKHEKETQANGRFDCYLAVDCSGSMEGVRTAEARKAALIFLEGLSAFQKDIESRQQQGSIDLDWDVRSSVYAFSTGAELIKPLTSSLTEKERLDVFSSINNPAGTTEDFMALESICEGIKLELGSKPENKNRRRIVIVLTDGESDNPERLASSINELNKLNVSVLAIGIETNSIGLYPSGKSIDDVKSLSKTLTELLEEEISR